MFAKLNLAVAGKRWGHTSDEVVAMPTIGEDEDEEAAAPAPWPPSSVVHGHAPAALVNDVSIVVNSPTSPPCDTDEVDYWQHDSYPIAPMKPSPDDGGVSTAPAAADEFGMDEEDRDGYRLVIMCQCCCGLFKMFGCVL